MSEVTNFMGFNEDTKEGSGSKYIEVTPETAIAGGRFIESLKYEKQEANEWFEIIVKNKQGQTANRRYFAPKIDGSIVKNEDDLKKAWTKFNKVMANLTRRFLGETYKIEGVNSFESYCNKVIKDIGNKYVGKELRIKLVLNSSDFPTLPSYAPIFEDITVPMDASKLSVSTQFDKVVRVNKPDTDNKPSNASEGVVDNTEADSLPF